jgi:DtxR family Mn-dependent transcriptional regulator
VPSTSTEDYLKTIYHLRDGDDPVATSAIAEAVDVTSPTVTKMMYNLSERGFVEREKYTGVRLTEEGEHVALKVLRRHRLLELLLTDHFDYDWADVHDEADRLEHHVSDELVDRIVEVLDDPVTDPHGAPIPTADLEVAEDSSDATLWEFEEGDTVVVTQVDDRNAEALTYLATVGITPGVRLEIDGQTPFGMISVEPMDNDESVSLSKELATVIHARRGHEQPPETADDTQMTTK